MIANKHFSFSRFNKTFKHDLVLHAKTYLFFVMAMIIVLFLKDVYDLINCHNNIIANSSFDMNKTHKIAYRYEWYKDSFWSVFLIIMIFVTSTAFPNLRNKRSTINYLILPSSTLEKFLVQFFIRLIVFVLIYTVLFWLVFKIAAMVCAFFGNIDIVLNFGLFTPFYSSNGNYLDIMVFLFLGLTAFLFAGASYFQKNAFFKTIISFVVLMLITYVFQIILSHLFLPEYVSGLDVKILQRPYNYKIIDGENVFDNGSLIKYNTSLYLLVINGLSCLLLFPFAYYRLKEKSL